MERHTDATDFLGALHVQSDDDTVEICILRPHETYSRKKRAQESADWTATEADPS
jgi:hypothetical protein